MKSISKWLGTTIDDRYVVDQFLDQGGMNRVFLATDNHLDCDVVIKMPHEDFVSEALTRRFEREAKALVKLRHPHIVPIHNIGTMDGIPYLVLEYLAGGDLRQQFDQDDLTPNRRLSNLEKWLPHVVDALTFIHSNGYVHRDVKPSNILFDEVGHPFLADFDITKNDNDEVPDGRFDGTPAYQAPEVPKGEVSPAADQYALAIMVYEQLAGSRPFKATNSSELLVQHASQKPVCLNQVATHVPAGVSNAVMRALSKSASERYPSCRALGTALMASLPGTQELTRGEEHRTEEKPSPAPFVVAAVVGAALLLLLLTRGCG